MLLRRKRHTYVCQAPVGGYQIMGVGWDVVCHSGSYGHECGLLESMELGWGEPEEYTDVVGYLTGEKVIEGIKCKHGL